MPNVVHRGKKKNLTLTVFVAGGKKKEQRNSTKKLHWQESSRYLMASELLKLEYLLTVTPLWAERSNSNRKVSKKVHK